MRSRAVVAISPRAGVALVVTFSLMPGNAWAEGRAAQDERTLRVDYQADPVCPDESAFVDLARQRVRAWPPPSEHPTLVARVIARKDGRGFEGRLVLEDDGRRRLGGREIHETNCDDVVLALALFLGVALEADAVDPARNERPPPPPPDIPTTPIAPPVASVMHEADLASTGRPEKSAEKSLEGYVTGGVHGVSGRTPNIAAGLALGIEARVPNDARIVPSFGLGVDVAPYSTIDRGRGHVTFGWGALVATGCVSFEHFRAPDREGQWEPWACARAEGGVLWAASSGYERNESATKPWLAAGADAGVALWVTPRVAFTLGGGAMVPILRQSFVLSGISLFRVPLVAAELGLGMKVRAW